MLSITVTMSGKTPEEVAAQFVELGNVLNAQGLNTGVELQRDDTSLANVNRAGKKQKPPKVDEEGQAEFDFNDTEPEVEPETENETEEIENFTGEDEPTPKAAKGKTAAPAQKTYKKEDVIKALQAYQKKFGRDKAMGILKKFHVKSVNDIDPKRYGQVIQIANLG